MPPHPYPERLRDFVYAMGVYADDRELRMHSAHPDQNGDQGPAGTDIRMPGGAVGRKTRPGA